MRIHHLRIDNFRGIKNLEWTLPAEQRLVALVGAGDSGKTTILDAIHLLLGDRWNVSFSDTDFFRSDTTTPISIEAVLIGLPDVLMKESLFGLWLSGIDAEGQLHQEPEDRFTPSLIVNLNADSSLEPRWTVRRVDGTAQSLTSSQRRHFSTFKVDDRTDTQLRWSRTSALGRMSAADGSEREALTAASRAARDALADHENLALAEVAKRVQERVNEIGGGSFSKFKPGLDTSRSSMGASLALYEDVVPLTSFGLGSRRLASLSVQQMAAESRSVAVVDELETGLEPHRAVRLLNFLQSAEGYSQVLITTHSPVIVEQAKIESLATVTERDGIVTVTSLDSSEERLQKLRRSRPSSFLGRRVVITEGKTEYGLLIACLDAWDEDRSSSGLSTSAGEGVALQQGEGGSEVALRGVAMRSLGYETAGFMDNDDRASDGEVIKAEKAGVPIFRWHTGFCTETELVSRLSESSLTSLLKLAVERRATVNTVTNDIAAVAAFEFNSLEVGDWVSAGVTIDAARAAIAGAAIASKWFKEVEGGKALGVWLLERVDLPELSDVWMLLHQIRDFVYPISTRTNAPTSTEGSD